MTYIKQYPTTSIPGRLSSASQGGVAEAGEIYDDQLQKSQSELNKETSEKLAELYDLISGIYTPTTIDDSLSNTSVNPVQNKVIFQALESKAGTDNIETILTEEIGKQNLVNSTYLSTNYYDRNSTNTILSQKQDIIRDLSSIREGALAGSSAIQSETDPVFKESPAYQITTDDIINWNNKSTITVEDIRDATEIIPQEIQNGVIIATINGITIKAPTAGATVQAQSDWNETDNTSASYIWNKPTIPQAITDYFPLTGGTITGNVEINETLTANNIITSKIYKTNTTLPNDLRDDYSYIKGINERSSLSEFLLPKTSVSDSGKTIMVNTDGAWQLASLNDKLVTIDTNQTISGIKTFNSEIQFEDDVQILNNNGLITSGGFINIVIPGTTNEKNNYVLLGGGGYKALSEITPENMVNSTGDTMTGTLSFDFSNKSSLPLNITYNSEISTRRGAFLQVTDTFDSTQRIYALPTGLTQETYPKIYSLAPIYSPNFSGTPTAPTAATGVSTNQIATTEFVNNAINNAVIETTISQEVIHSSIDQYLQNYVHSLIKILYINGQYNVNYNTINSQFLYSNEVFVRYDNKIYPLIKFTLGNNGEMEIPDSMTFALTEFDGNSLTYDEFLITRDDSASSGCTVTRNTHSLNFTFNSTNSSLNIVTT